MPVSVNHTPLADQPNKARAKKLHSPLHARRHPAAPPAKRAQEMRRANLKHTQSFKNPLWLTPARDGELREIIATAEVLRQPRAFCFSAGCAMKEWYVAPICRRRSSWPVGLKYASCRALLHTDCCLGRCISFSIRLFHLLDEKVLGVLSPC